MARIPLQNGGALPAAPQGARVPLAQNLPIGETPIPRQGEQWAKALGQASEAFQVMAKKTAEANDTRQLIEAEGDMRRHAMEFQQFQQTTTDQDQWLPEWQKRQTEMQKRMDGLKLTDGARLRLTSSFGRWSDSNAIAIQGEAFKQSVGRAKQAVVNRANESAASGDFQGIQSALSLLPDDYTTPEERESLRLELDGKAKAVARDQLSKQVGTALDLRDIESAKAMVQESPHLSDIDRAAQLARIDATHAVNAQKDEFQALSLQEPQKALTELDDPGKFSLVSIGDRELMKVQAKNILAGQSSDAWRDIKTRIDLGQVKKGETFDAIKELDPLTRDVAKFYNADYHNKAGMNSTSEYEAAVASIDNLKDDGSGLPRAQLEAGIESRFSGAYEEQLKKRLDARFTAPNQAEILKEPLAQLHRWAFDEKRLGEFEKPALGPDGNPIVTETTVKTAVPDTSSGFLWWRRLPWMGGPVPTGTSTVIEQVTKQIKPVMQDDPAKRDKIAAQIGMIRVQLEKDVQSGEVKTPEGAMKRMAELAKMPFVKQASVEASSAPTMSGAMPLVNGLQEAVANPLVPVLDAPKIDINELLKRYAPNP
jgi:hypothetical protein